MRAPTLAGLIDRLRSRKQGYQLMFGQPGSPGHDMWIDLATFCRAFVPTFHPDARMHARLEGRREVWLRITEHLKLEPEELAALYRAVVLQHAGEQQ